MSNEDIRKQFLDCKILITEENSELVKRKFKELGLTNSKGEIDGPLNDEIVHSYYTSETYTGFMSNEKNLQEFFDNHSYQEIWYDFEKDMFTKTKPKEKQKIYSSFFS